MSDHGYSFGAHLLMWVFPLLLVAAAVAAHLLGGRSGSGGDRR
jgi:hypothetical protein